MQLQKQMWTEAILSENRNPCTILPENLMHEVMHKAVQSFSHKIEYYKSSLSKEYP